MADSEKIQSIAKGVLQQNLANIAIKVKEGKVLTKEERLLFESFTNVDAPTGAEETANTLAELSERLGVTIRTIQRWRKKYDDAPRSLSIPQWVAFRNLISSPREEENLAARKVAAEARKAELACEKLELEIANLKGEMVRRDEVRQDGVRLGSIIRSAFSKLERELLGRLEGKTPEERQSETRIVVAEAIAGINKELEKE
jgi:DNA-binding transcriptional MerR regulator